MSASPEAGPVLLFDGVCNLCHAAVRFVLRRDHEAVFRFAPLDSEVGRRLTEHRFAAGDLPDSVILIEDGQLHVGFEAAVLILRRLGAPWSWLSVVGLLPRSIGDRLYDAVARNRYRWFGRKDACPLPDADLEDRFLS